MKPHTRAQLKSRTRVFYSSRVAEVCEIIDEEYTSLVINSADFHSRGISFIRAVDKYQLSPVGERRGTLQARYVMQAQYSIWGWYIGKYIIVRPTNAEMFR